MQAECADKSLGIDKTREDAILLTLAFFAGPALQAHFAEGGAMYILFGPALAALVVIAVIQLRDHFVPSR